MVVILVGLPVVAFGLVEAVAEKIVFVHQTGGNNSTRRWLATRSLLRSSSATCSIEILCALSPALLALVMSGRVDFLHADRALSELCGDPLSL